ncbi:glycosyl hydrolase [Bacteroides oleiciplenus]|uniref:glycosyl hydrolase n=1 Tax=Bacteroides oleiciplenus TaxID=626931 RepID=UPI0026DC432D|nr:glycosyl hydrolase [Bacteroides oleiciplenus]
MNNNTIWKFGCLILILWNAIQVMQAANFDRKKPFVDHESDLLQKGFLFPSDSVRTAVYWYWVNDHISQEGVIKDLHAMKAAGINRVFIGSNIRNRTSWSRDLTGQWFGNVKWNSDEWWEILHTALKTASELDIETGLFNCPGWSQSGGPWIKPEQAMRYLDASELRVKGPLKLSRQLTQPDTLFQDVKVLAFPVAPDYEQNLLEMPGAIITSSGDLQVASSFNQDKAKYILAGGEGSLYIELPDTITARSLTLYPFEYMNLKVEVQVKDGGEYKTVHKFNIERRDSVENPASAGFEPYAPYAHSLGELKSKFFRLIFNKIGKEDSRMSRIVLGSTPVLKNLTEKKLAKIWGGNPLWKSTLWQPQPAYSASVDVPQARQVIDISSFMSADGILNWNVPEGEWIIMRTGMRVIDVRNGPVSFEAEGLEADKLNKEHIQSHFDAFIGEVLRRVPEEDRKTLKVVVVDSYERGGQNFTDGFLNEFKQRYGYDATPFLPVFKGHIIGNPDVSDRFLWDVRRFVADKVAYDYVGGLTEASHKHGMVTWIENYGHSGFPGEFLQYGGQADEVSGEFWDEPIRNSRYENRGAASAAHIYGKKHVWAESFTSGSWDNNKSFSSYPKRLKRYADYYFAEGINSTLLHVYIQQAYEDVYPGVDAWFGTEFNRKNTWFSHVDLFIQYLKRCNYMLQQGLNVADVAYYIGEDTPKMTGIRQPEIPQGYSYDYINSEVILRDMYVRDGRLVLPHGTTYRLLVLPPQDTMRPEVLAKIEQLVADGAIVLGQRPNRSPSLQNYPDADRIVQEAAGRMWGDASTKYHRYGKGMVMKDLSLEEVFRIIEIAPDCLVDNPSVRYLHRSLGDKDIYFLTNISDKPVSFIADFRIKGMQPELWDAVTGTTRPLPVFHQNGEITGIPLHLEVDGSMFIVFRTEGLPSNKKGLSNFPLKKNLSVEIAPWMVTFEHDSIKRGPSEPVIFHELKDWTECDDERIRYYSGTAVYSTILTLGKVPKNQKLYLDLGDLSAMAKVKVNGEYVGGVWTSPYQLEVTGKLRKGKNKLEVEVVNTWMNRLIGDHRLAPEERIVKTDNNHWKADSPLQPSGLLGPVSILSIE